MAADMLAVAKTPANGVHELKTLVLSRHPVIAVEAEEEERVAALVRAMAADLRRGRLPPQGPRAPFRHPARRA